MRKGNFTGRGIDVAAEQPGIARRVVGRAERPLRHQRLPGFQQADDAVNLRRLQRLVQRERRQNRRQPLRQHGFAGAGRPDQHTFIDLITTTCYILAHDKHRNGLQLLAIQFASTRMGR